MERQTDKWNRIGIIGIKKKKDEEGFGCGGDAAGAARRHVTVWASSTAVHCRVAATWPQCWLTVRVLWLEMLLFCLFVCLFKTITHITITLLYNTACVSVCISLHDRFHVSIGKMSNRQLSAFKACFTFILCCSCVEALIMRVNQEEKNNVMISNKIVSIIISHSNNISRSGSRSSCCRCCRSLAALWK